MASPERRAVQARRQAQAQLLKGQSTSSKRRFASLSAQRRAALHLKRAAAEAQALSASLAHSSRAVPSPSRCSRPARDVMLADEISDVEEDEELLAWLDGLGPVSPTPKPSGAVRSLADRREESSAWVRPRAVQTRCSQASGDNSALSSEAGFRRPCVLREAGISSHGDAPAPANSPLDRQQPAIPRLALSVVADFQSWSDQDSPPARDAYSASADINQMVEEYLARRRFRHLRAKQLHLQQMLQ
ncbi:MAG: hypothetical protein SGPRY_012861, partial [Prymnesium sp.]